MKTLTVTFVLLTLLVASCLQDDPDFDFGTDFPIRTTEEAYDYSVENLNIACEGDDFLFETSIPSDLEPDENGFYGNKGVTIIDGEPKIIAYLTFTGCQITTEYDDQGRPKSGTFAYRLRFDPNNGHINEQSCNWDLYPEQCPKDESGEYILIRGIPYSDNPLYETYINLQ